MTSLIRANDTFSLLSERFKCSVADIEKVNPGVNPKNLQIGQRINIPVTNTAGSSSSDSNVSISREGVPSGARIETTLNAKIPDWCKPLRQWINSAAKECNVPADLIAAVIYQESGGKLNVNSTTNANGGSDSGLMQVNPLKPKRFFLTMKKK